MDGVVRGPVMVVDTLLLALGANQAGAWGPPDQTLVRARQELACAGVRILAASHLYDTVPLGPGRQSPYLNAVLLSAAHLGPAALLRLMKRLERRAGRRLSTRWGPRCLDIDILDFGGRRLGWSRRRLERRAPGRLVLPHPQIDRRAFVLIPLLEVHPHWQHPTLSATGRALLARLPPASRRGVRRSLALAASACEKRGVSRAPRK
jgi:2-amino-4-hydroxy-6-hydroxymethyldihydropteridine diphosphokinase